MLIRFSVYLTSFTTFFQQIEIISEKKGSNIIVRRLGLATIILKNTQKSIPDNTMR